MIYNATNGDRWTRNNNWLTSANYCTWNLKIFEGCIIGVSCNADGEVTGLDSEANKVEGTLP